MARVVLCLDSRESNLKADKWLLERAGYEVLAAATLEQAAVMAAHRSIDLVLVSDDLSFDDDELCAQLHDIAPSARIILQRAGFDKATAPPDADLVLPKTIDPRQKLLLMAHLLARQAA